MRHPSRGCPRGLRASSPRAREARVSPGSPGAAGPRPGRPPPLAPRPASGWRQDARLAQTHQPLQPMGPLARAHGADLGQDDMAAVELDPERPGAEGAAIGVPSGSPSGRAPMGSPSRPLRLNLGKPTETPRSQLRGAPPTRRPSSLRLWTAASARGARRAMVAPSTAGLVGIPTKPASWGPLVVGVEISLEGPDRPAVGVAVPAPPPPDGLPLLRRGVQGELERLQRPAVGRGVPTGLPTRPDRGHLRSSPRQRADPEGLTTADAPIYYNPLP